MFLLSMCDKSYMLEIFLIIKIFLQLVCYIVPLIIIIISIISLFKTIQSGKQDDMKDTLKIFARRIISGLIVIFIPTLVNYVFTSLIDGSGVEIVACLESATAEKVASLKESEEATAKAEAEAQAKEDEEAQKTAYEEEHKNDEAKKEAFENATKNKGNTSTSTSVEKLLSAAKKADETTYNNNYHYGNATTWDGTNMVGTRGGPPNTCSSVAGSTGNTVSCDRGVALALYYAGIIKDSPNSYDLVTLNSYLLSNGWQKITNVSDLQPGDIVFYDRNHNGSLESTDHVFLVGETVNQRYDWGSCARIHHSGNYSSGMPFTENVDSSQFGWALRMPS